MGTQATNTRFRNVMIVIGVISLSIFTLQLIQIVSESNAIVEKAKEQTLAEAKDAANIVDERFQNMIALAHKTSDELSSGQISYETLEKDVGKNLLDNTSGSVKGANSNIGLTVAFEPYAYHPDSLFYSPFFRIKDESLWKTYINYDYTDTENEANVWYTKPIKRQEGCWIEPRIARGSKQLYMSYQLPFYQTSPKTDSLPQDSKGRYMAGVVCTDYNLETLWSDISRLGNGKTSYGFLITPKGKIISHPVRSYLNKDVNELELSDIEAGLLRNLPKDISKNSSKVIDNQWVFYQEVPVKGWVLGIVYSEDEMIHNFSTNIRKKTMTTTLAGVIAIIAIAFLLFRPDRSKSGSGWKFSWSVTTICAVGMGMIWYLSMRFPHKPAYENAIIYHESNIYSTLGNLGLTDDSAKYIPTGFFVQTVEFQGANNLLVNGYIWQKFEDDSIPKPEEDPDIFFPESESAEYSRLQESDNTIMWEFTVELRQPFNYADYPFDSEDIWLRIRPNGFDNHIYLTPDLSAYQSNVANDKPGISNDLILGDWDCKGSYYSYRLTNYNSNFGFKPENINIDLVDGRKTSDEVLKQRLEPELFFNIEVQRDFLSPFIGEVAPILVVAFLVFAILLTQSRDEEKMALTGFNSSGVLGYCASLYFVLIVSHVYTREKLAAGYIVYIEYFYFVMYFILLWISLMSLLFVSDHPRLKIWNQNDAFLVKVVYWPLFFGIMFTLTLIQFI